MFFRYLATCSADTTVKIWSISQDYEFKQEKVLQGHQRWVWDCAFSADSAYLVTGFASVVFGIHIYPFHFLIQHHPIIQLVYGKWRPVKLSDNIMVIIRVRSPKLYYHM